MRSKDSASRETEAMSDVSQRSEMVRILEEHRGEHHIVVLQDFPDPDAISSAFAHRLISSEFDIEADLVYGGRISHYQNIALVKLLGIGLIRYSEALDLGQYAGAVFVDNQGTTAEVIVQGLEAAGVPVLIVVDHHEPQDRLVPQFSDVRQVGAVATIYAGYLEGGLIDMDKSRKDHVAAATALMHGIITDTNGFVRATPEDFQAAAFLSRFRNADTLGQIMSQARSKQTMEIIRRALGDRVIVESFSVAGIGYLRAEDRDVIPQAADFLLTEENIHTAIIYGIVIADEGKEILIGSMRTSRITIDPDEFIKDAVGKDATGHYLGGGRQSAGGFEVPIGFLSGGTGEEYQDQKWQVYDAQMKHRIFVKIGVQPPAM